MNYDIEKKSDELLEAIGTELMKSREKYANMVLEGKKVPLYKEKTESKQSPRRVFRRMKIFVALLIMLMAIALVAVDAVEEKVFNYFLVENLGHTEITPLKGNAFPEVELEYLPKGYVLISSEENEVAGVWLSYGTAEENFIEFSMCRSEYYNPSVDNDTMKYEEVEINVYQAQLFSDDQDCYIVWQVGYYTLSIYGNLDKETIMKIADNVRLNDL